MSAVLEAKNICAYYGPTQVLFGLDVRLAEGGITTMLGANGAGKTTMLRALCGMVRTTGEIRLGGDSVLGQATEDIVRRGVAHVPEGRGTFTRQTVEENLQIGAMSRRDTKAIPGDIERVYGYFPRLKERRNQQAGTLSGGEQQMLAIGRALMSRPRMLLMDEPSMGIAPILVLRIFDAVRELNQQGMTVLLVEQNARQALKLAHRGYVLENGRIVMTAPAAELAESDEVRKAYLGVE
jgi:branched-chain amino acid transport system ATP-binding protein